MNMIEIGESTIVPTSQPESSVKKPKTRAANPRKPRTNTPPNKSQKLKEPAPTATNPTLESFVGALLKPGKACPAIEKLPAPDQETAALLLMVLDDLDFHPQNLGKFKVLPESSQIKLIKNTGNYHFLTQIFFEMHAYPVGKTALKKIIENFHTAP